MTLQVTVYGGAAGRRADRHGEIGGNRILVETGERTWFCDFGTRFKALGRFYEEFLRPRGSTLGLRDFLRMGPLPPVEGLTATTSGAMSRTPGTATATTPHNRRIEGVDGVLVSHAHLDHTGNLGFLRKDTPSTPA